MLWIRLRRFSVLVFALLMAACAGPVQLPVSLGSDYLSAAKSRGGKIGVVMGTLPKVDTEFPGAGCLLCLAVANGNHSALSKVVQAFSADDLKPLPSDLVALLKKRGLDAVLISEPLVVADMPKLDASDPTNKSRKNFAALKSKHGIDKLLLVDITALGIWRSYAAYVPTDVPRAVMNGSASLIDLSTHTLEWYLPLAMSRAADGTWDEPPKFPGLTNAYYQVLERGMSAIKEPFLK